MLRIYSDGQPHGTRVIDTVTGAVIPGLVGVQFLHPEMGEKPKVILLFEASEVEVLAPNAEIKKIQTSRKAKKGEGDPDDAQK